MLCDVSLLMNVLMLVQVLKLICMQSVANSGLKPRLLEYYKREIMQVYFYGLW